MKKEEAIKFLSSTKVYVDGKSKEIQKKLFEFGFKWDRYDNRVDYTNMPFLYINENKLIQYGSDMDKFSIISLKELSAEEILSIKIEPECPFKPFDRVLVRDSDSQRWQGTLISHVDKNSGYDWKVYTLTGSWYQIIHYEGNEHLVGTNKSPKQ